VTLSYPPSLVQDLGIFRHSDSAGFGNISQVREMVIFPDISFAIEMESSSHGNDEDFLRHVIVTKRKAVRYHSARKSNSTIN